MNRGIKLSGGRILFERGQLYTSAIRKLKAAKDFKRLNKNLKKGYLRSAGGDGKPSFPTSNDLYHQKKPKEGDSY